MRGLLTYLRAWRLRRDLAEGRPQSLEDLFESQAGKLYHYALSILRRQELAEEVVQEVFLEMARHPERLSQVHNLSVYLYQAVRNRASARGQREAREVVAEASIFETPDPDDPLGRLEDRLALAGALDQLPPEQREVLLLKTYQHLTFQEIGKVLSISPNTAASRHRYALAQLRETLKGSSHGRSRSAAPEPEAAPA